MKSLPNLILRNKNIGFLLLSSVLYFSINAFLSKYIAENFGTNGLLEFNYALNLFAILFAVSCFGSETALVRQSIFFEAKNIDGFKELFSAISFFGIVISIPVLVFFFIYYFQKNFEIIIASLVIIFSAFFIQFIRIQFLKNSLGFVLQIIQSGILLILMISIFFSENPTKENFFIFLIIAYFIAYLSILLIFYLFKPFGFKDIPVPYPKNLINSEQIKKINTVTKIASMTLISNIFFNFSEVYLRDIAISNGHSTDFANVEAYIRVTSWWLGLGISLISFFYFPFFTKKISEGKLVSNLYAFKHVAPVFLLLSFFGFIFSFLAFEFIFGRLFQLDLSVMIFFVLSGLFKLIGISFSGLHLIELRLKIFVVGEFLMTCLIVIIFYFLFMYNVDFSVNLFSKIYFFTNSLFMLFMILCRSFTKPYHVNNE